MTMSTERRADAASEEGSVTMREYDDLRDALETRLDDRGADWLREAEKRVAAEPAAIRTLFPAAGRGCGQCADTLDGPGTVSR